MDGVFTDSLFGSDRLVGGWIRSVSDFEHFGGPFGSVGGQSRLYFRVAESFPFRRPLERNRGPGYRVRFGLRSGFDRRNKRVIDRRRNAYNVSSRGGTPRVRDR